MWAWPVGIIGNVLLFSVFIAATFEADAQVPLFGQAGRQSSSSSPASTAGGAGRRCNGPAAAAPTGRRSRPRWATTRERAGYLVASLAAIVLVQWVFSIVGAGWPAPRWYFWADAWIFVGSMLATYAMARGWTDFWLAWIAVDLVGVPLLWHSQYYPTAILFVFYGVLVLWGFVVWLRASRVEQPRARTGGVVSAPHVRLDHRRAGGRRHRRRQGRWWSSTTRTARTRAT